MKYLVNLIFLYCVLCSGAKAQEFALTDTSGAGIDTTIQSPMIAVSDIRITGNKKTKPYIILREVSFRKGDNMLMSELQKRIEEAKHYIMNTSLFVEVNVYMASQTGDSVVVNIDVKERWYLFPLPYFKIVDRNFNQWWVEHNRDLSRVNYGLKFNYANASGRNDKISLYLVTGYSRLIAFGYSQPFADKSLKHGFGVSFQRAQAREMVYGTDSNKQAFIKTDGFIRTSTSIHLNYYYRPAIKSRHTVRLSYGIDKVNDTILKLNPRFWGDSNRTTTRFPELAYVYQYFNVDYIPYPSSGLLGTLHFLKRGIDKQVNLWQFGFNGTYTKTIFPKSQIQFQAGGVLRFPLDQPYYNQQLFGYGDLYLRGLEYYVVDASAGFVVRGTARKEVLSFVVKNPIKRMKSHDKVPFRFFLKAFTDAGYAYSKHEGNSRLNNRWLRTWGVGLDVLTFYDFVIKIEYSFNQLGNNGVFLHSKSDF
jgi:outer membrane protein assembly factor BamA